MSITNEQLAKARTAKSVEELIGLAKEEGFELSEKDARRAYDLTHPSFGELSDDELESVAGGEMGGITDGLCQPEEYASGDAPIYSVGEEVIYHYGIARLKGTITWVTNMKIGNQFQYGIQVTDMSQIGSMPIPDQGRVDFIPENELEKV